MPEYIEREALLNNRPEGRNVGQIGKEEYNKGWNDCRHAFYECICKESAADVVAVETVKAWLYAIAMNNVGVKADDVASVCEDIAERMDGLRAFARERSGEE